MASGRKNAPATISGAPLREEVKLALLAVLRDSEAPPAARASAGRTLLEHFDDRQPDGARSVDDMSETELDQLIASHKTTPRSGD